VIVAGDRPLLAFRLVIGATLVALLWKVMFFIVIANVYLEMPLRQRLFPAFFESAVTFAASYATVALTLLCVLLARGSRVRRWGTWLAFAGVSTLCLHQGSYNDATFTTAWWTLLWSAWFAGRLDQGDEDLLARGARLSRAILAVILLGGAVGKWTPEYWSGQVLYEIYFTERDFWLFNLLRANVDPAPLREIATWYSRGVVLLESAAGLTLWLLPARVAALVGASIFAGITVFSNALLASVTLSMVGLSVVGLLAVPPVPDTPQAPRLGRAGA
jgi:hypothetical protein